MVGISWDSLEFGYLWVSYLKHYCNGFGVIYLLKAKPMFKLKSRCIGFIYVTFYRVKIGFEVLIALHYIFIY